MNKHDRLRRDRLVLRYLDALDAGNLEAVAALWDEAAADPALEQALLELSDGLFVEDGLGTDWARDAERVRALLKQHLPSGIPHEAPSRPLTAGDVAARLKADDALGASLSEVDRAANERLLADHTPLPEQLGQLQLKRWTAGLGVTASERYWRAFRQTAVLLVMSRCQREGELAAARKAQPLKGDRRAPRQRP
jgi:hypothetical protein